MLTLYNSLITKDTAHLICSELQLQHPITTLVFYWISIRKVWGKTVPGTSVT